MSSNPATFKPFVVPTQEEICEVLHDHPLIKLRERVVRAFLVGSHAQQHLGVGTVHAESDVDILLEVVPRAGEEAREMEDRYRQRLRQHFVTHNIRTKDDSVHPQWCGRRVDVYFTFDAAPEERAKVELERLSPGASASPNQGRRTGRRP